MAFAMLWLSLLKFLVLAPFQSPTSAYVVRPQSKSEPLTVSLLEEPIFRDDKLIYAIIPVPQESNPGDIIVTKMELEGYDESFSVDLAIVITDKKVERSGRELNPTNILKIIEIPVQPNTVELLLQEKLIESYINYKQKGIRYQTKIAFLVVGPSIGATE